MFDIVPHYVLCSIYIYIYIKKLNSSSFSLLLSFAFLYVKEGKRKGHPTFFTYLKNILLLNPKFYYEILSLFFKNTHHYKKLRFSMHKTALEENTSKQTPFPDAILYMSENDEHKMKFFFFFLLPQKFFSL